MVPKLPPISLAITRTDFKGYIEDGCDFFFLADDAARAGIKRVTLGFRVVDADSCARLHRYAGHAIDPGIEPCHVGSASERFVGRLGVAYLGVDHDIRQIVVKPRSATLDGDLGIGHCRQRLIFDNHLLGGVFRLRDRFGDDEGDGGADMPHAIRR